MRDFRLVGDPHLGKKFTFGVPLDRRGEREKEVRMLFHRQAQADSAHHPGQKTFVLGDLFDKPNVSNEDLLVAMNAFRYNPELYCLAGNHDVGHNLQAKTALDVLAFWFPKRIIKEPTWLDRVLIMPWQEDRTAIEQVEALPKHYPQLGVDYVLGHWNEKAYGRDAKVAAHVCPAARLRELFPDAEIISGHVHKPHKAIIDGVGVRFWGSMQPYAHGEDGDDIEPMYVTRHVEDL